MLNVGHFVETCLCQTETFIYNYIRAFQSINSFVYAYKVENMDQFGAINPTKIWKYSFSRFIYKLFGQSKIGKEHIFNLNNTHSIRSHLRHDDVRLVHSHFGPMGCYNVNLKKHMGLPMVTTYYGWDVSLLPRIGWGEKYMLLFSMGDCFLVEGSHMKKCLVELGCPENKIKIIHIGVDTKSFKYRERRMGDGEKTIMLFCGRLIEKKGLEYALRALALVKDKYRNVEFRVIGDGRLKDHIIRLIQDLGLDHMVKLLGYIPYVKTKGEMDNAHILIQPSVTATNGETEGGAPAVLIEGQACGMPVLASFHADIPEVVLDKQSGLLSEERNFEQLAENMAYLFEHPEKWAEMGSVGRRHVEQNYNVKTEAAKMEQIYGDLVG